MTTKFRKLFVNLAVRELGRSKEFFSRLGFEFDPRFTDHDAACMIVSEDARVMLLGEAFFKTFTNKQICSSATHSEALLAVSAGSRANVDELAEKAAAAGATPAMAPVDHGFMYCRSFCDLDGHHWEVVWMDALAA